jgi:hypothetical protein
MSGHDAFARLTPYELSFPDLAFARRHFAAIRREGEARGVDLRDPGAFIMLAASGQALREIRGPQDAGPHAERGEVLIHQYGFLLYHAFHFCEAGEPLYLVQASALREVIEQELPAAAWAPALEPRAGYVQLPQHIVWVRAAPGLPPESLDGFFWARGSEGCFGLLLALGMRADRPGLSVVPLSELPIAEAGEGTRMQMREAGGGGDFTSSLPGSDLEGLYELRTSGEALKLAARMLWRLETPTGIEAAERTAPSAAGKSAATPRPSALAFRRVKRRQTRAARSPSGRRGGRG